MKKFYAIALAAVAALTANAENMQFTVHGNPVKNGDRIDIAKYYQENEWGGGGQYFTELFLTPSVSGIATTVLDFFKNDTTPYNDDWTKGADVSASCCALDGTCVPVKALSKVTKEGEVIAGKAIDMQIEMMISLGDEQKIEDLFIDSEFSVTTTLAGETCVLYFYVKQDPGSGVDGIVADQNAPVRYYDMQGREVAEPRAGIYIKRQGTKATKVIL